MEIIRINDHVSVSPQIAVEDVAILKQAGFVTIVNNRPDGEEEDQTPGAEIRKAVEAAGLKYVEIPMGRQGVNAQMIEETRNVLDNSQGPVFCYCRSGTRSTTLWALSQAGRMPAEEIIQAAADAGYNIRHLAGHLS
ncbi:MAG: TIGR01244 family phosphatase [Hyphomicrobiaceae bacterium]|nr:TIGR01244 family phosphatase [Hyphomicrobiaceae bacterium]